MFANWKHDAQFKEPNSNALAFKANTYECRNLSDKDIGGICDFESLDWFVYFYAFLQF